MLLLVLLLVLLLLVDRFEAAAGRVTGQEVLGPGLVVEGQAPGHGDDVHGLH